jgi:metal-responsive CopG/Arc/MetJ family transcriptional regulator
MAKVMVSLPDDLLRAIDTEASRRGTTRSGLLRDMAAETLERRRGQRSRRMRELNREAGSHGGAVADLVKRHRPGV